MRVFILFLLVAWILPAFAEPIPTLFNTGLDSNRNPLPAGAPDPHYQFVGTDPRFATNLNAIVVNEGWPIGPAWLGNSAQSKWIAPGRNQTEGCMGSGVYVYQTTFDLTGFHLNSVKLKGRWASDNFGYQVLLNGNQTGISNTLQFASWTSFSITNGFREGTNVLTFIVFNGFDVPNPNAPPPPPDPTKLQPPTIDPNNPALPNINPYLAGTGLNVSLTDPTGFRVEFEAEACPIDAPPFILQQPRSQIAAEGDRVQFMVLGSQCGNPLSYQWRFKGQNIAGANGPVLTLENVQRSQAGDYDAVLTNAKGVLTSAKATLTLGRTIPSGLFSTGVGPTGELLPPGETDPHYELVESSDFEFSGPAAFVTSLAPIPPWVMQGPNSQWIAPQPNQHQGNPGGRYVFRTTFRVDGFDLNQIMMIGRWAVDDVCPDLVLNGQPLSISNNSGFDGLAEFQIRNGFVPGLNTLDIPIVNGGVSHNPTGLRFEPRLIDLAFGEFVPPRLEITRQQSIQIKLIGKKGQRYRIESRDVLDEFNPWQTFRETQLLSADFEVFPEPDPLEFRFYRVVQLP